MRFTVKYEINQYRIFDEDRKPAGVLRRSLTSGNSLEIFDASGQRIGRAVRGSGEIIGVGSSRFGRTAERSEG